jgi:hypothetical protein
VVQNENYGTFGRSQLFVARLYAPEKQSERDTYDRLNHTPAKLAASPQDHIR